MIKRKEIPLRQDSLIFEITQRCNNNCIHCYNVWKGNTTYPRGELDLTTLKRLLSKLIKETSCKQITLSGGEPLLREDLSEIISFIRHKDLQVGIISNGVLYSERIAKEHVKLGIGIFELPLLGAKKSLHNELSRSNSFDKVTEAIANIKLAGGMVVGVFVGTKVNIDDFQETAELMLGLGVDGIMFNRFNVGGEGAKHIEKLLPSPEQVKRALDVAEGLSERFNISISSSIPIQPCLVELSPYRRVSFGYCAAGTDRAYYTVDPLGNLRMCNHTPSILGNLLEHPFKKLIRNPLAGDFMEAKPMFCRDCPMEDICLGGCKAAAEACCGSLRAEEPFLARYKDQAVIPKERLIPKLIPGD